MTHTHVTMEDRKRIALVAHDNMRKPIMTGPRLLALDFDGVICDTVREGCRSAWQVCRDIVHLNGDAPPPELMSLFVRLRPVLEHGWEFPALVLAILDGIPESTIWQDFQTTCRQRVLDTHRLTPKDLAARFDAARDRTIRRSLDEWLDDQGLYPGMAERLRAILQTDVALYVITTKEGRFAHKLLEVGGVTLPPDRVWGKEQARPKPELLRVLSREHAVAFPDIWFVEDRLKTLQSVTPETDLAEVGLFLATWGYLMPGDLDEAARDPRLVPITLDQFCRDFSAWRGTQ